MAKKKTRLQELEDYARSIGLWVATYNPGGVPTRYRFFDKAGNSYFGPQSGIHTADGLKSAWDFAYAYAAGARR